MKNKLFKRKSDVVITISIITILISLIGFTYSYFSARITENNKTQTIIKSNVLGLVYTGVTDINVQDIIPGDYMTKTFTVKNTSNREVDYNIYMENITNEFNEDLVYTVSDENGVVIEEGSLPETKSGKTYIKTGLKIDTEVTKNFALTIKFKYSQTIDQNALQGKVFNATLGIDTEKIENTSTVPAPVAFATDSWETISTAVKSGNYPYQVKDTRVLDLGDLGTFTLRVSNTSTPTDCSNPNFSQTACGFVVEFVEIANKTMMRERFSPDYIGNKVGFEGTDAYIWLRDELYPALPSDMQNAIINTKIVSGHGADVIENHSFDGKLYILAPREVYGSSVDSYNNDTAKDLLRQLDYYEQEGISVSNYHGAAKTYNGVATDWWQRSAYNGMSDGYYSTNSTGWPTHDAGQYQYGVSPVFRIG